MRGARIFSLLGVVAIAVLLAAGCTEDGELPTTTSGDGGEGTTTSAAETTEAPETTQAPETTEGNGGGGTTTPSEEGDETFPVWIVVLAGAVVIGLLIWAATRGGGRRDVTVAAAVPGWKDRAQAGYSASRWLYDALTEGLAIWRGNAQFSGTTSEGSTAETGNAATWEQLSGRMNQARDDLYAMEAGAPDPNTARVARSVVDSLNATRAAVDARAEARYQYRTVEAGSSDDRPQALGEARDREQRAASNLDAARQSLAEALTALSAVT